MKLSILTLSTLLSAFQLSQAAVDYTGHKLLQLDVTNDAEVAAVNAYVAKNKADVWNHVRVGKVDLRLTPKQFNTVSKDLSIKYEILSDNIQKLLDQEQLTSQSRAAAADFTESYHSYSEITQWLDQIASASNGTAKTFTVGTSYEGRPIKGITFRKPGSSPKKAILYHGGIHAREWISPATNVYLINAFSNYSSDSTLKGLLDTFEYTIIPVVNPDGYEYTRSGDRLWRKNRQPNNDCFGTDLNRNWSYQWKAGTACDDGFPGSSPFSAPETKAIANYISTKGNIISYIDFHSYGQLFMHPYAYSCTALPKDFSDQDSVAKAGNDALRSVNGRSYRQGTICKTIYPAFGSSVDWTYIVANVKYPFAIELPDTGNYKFILPASYIPSTGAEILAAVKAISVSVKAKEGL